MKVEFIEVGRFKKSWTADLKEISYDSLYLQVKPHLLSNDIEFTMSGHVLVSGIRTVGKFRILEEEGDDK